MVDVLEAAGALVRSAVAASYGSQHADVDPQVRLSERADLQADLAPGLARVVGGHGRQVAERIAAALPPNDVIADVAVGGPGFLNIHVRPAWLAAAVGRIATDERLGVPRAAVPDRVVIDYSHPNVAKQMHVGHLRTTVIGDCLVRVLAFRGHTVIRQNHIGDWGTQFGMLLETLAEHGDLGRAGELDLADVTATYQAANARYRADEEFAARARERVVKLQSGEPATLDAWRGLVAVSQRYFEQIYARLGVTLQPGDVAGESSYNDRLAGLVSELEQRGLVRESEGAMCAFPDGFVGRTGAPLPLIVRKSDGGFNYGTTDLAALRHRVATLGATRILYVVGAPQTQHLAMVFAVARAAGWLESCRVEHVDFGSVLDANGEPLSTREGTAPSLVRMFDDAIAAAEAALRAAARESGKPIDEASLPETLHILGIGAIKYADLASERGKGYRFDLAQMMCFTGNTAGYAQYACARARLVVEKAGGEPGPVVLAAPEERALALQLVLLSSVLRAVEATLEPHRLTNYIHALAVAFSRFYEACPIRDAAPDVRSSRVTLATATARTLASALDLIGVGVPRRM